MDCTTAPHTEAYLRAQERNWKPRNCVWELTLACNLRCRHCGSRAGKPLENELSTSECLDLVQQLQELGCELITLSGGEPTLRHDWDQIAKAISERNILVNMVTNGVFRSSNAARDIAQRAQDAGMCNIGISVDGPKVVHEALRGRGTFAKTISAIEQFVAMGIKVAVMTTVNRLNLNLLTETRNLVREVGAEMWRLQLAKPMGNMSDLSELTIDPQQLLQLIPRLAKLKKQGGISIRIGDSIGYYGIHDRTLRGWGWRGRPERWQGCQAGMQAIGIEANGNIKGCLSLQANRHDHDPFVEGNIRERSLQEIWYQPNGFSYNREFDPNLLSGFCRECTHGSICRGGARCVSTASIGAITEDPYCFYMLDAQHRAALPPRVGQSATAAAAIALSIGSAGCYSTGDPKEEPPRVSANSSTEENTTAADASTVTAGNRGTIGSAQPIVLDSGMDPLPTGQPDYGVEPQVVLDYGIEFPIDASILKDAKKTVDAEPEPDAEDDATVESDAELEPDGEKPIDCTTVYCDCEYGIIPQDTYEQCCQPDPCENVCCECEYGIIPQDTYEQCCQPDPCENVCCMCDYGVTPIPPECCK